MPTPPVNDSARSSRVRRGDDPDPTRLTGVGVDDAVNALGGKTVRKDEELPAPLISLLFLGALLVGTTTFVVFVVPPFMEFFQSFVAAFSAPPTM